MQSRPARPSFGGCEGPSKAPNGAHRGQDVPNQEEFGIRRPAEARVIRSL